MAVWAATLASSCAFDVVSIFSHAIPHAKLITNEIRIESALVSIFNDIRYKSVHPVFMWIPNVDVRFGMPYYGWVDGRMDRWVQRCPRQNMLSARTTITKT